MAREEQHSLLTSIVLHLYPGFVILGLYLLFVPLTNRIGYPPLLALMAAALIVLLGFELGHLFREGYKRNGNASLKDASLKDASLKDASLKDASLKDASLKDIILYRERTKLRALFGISFAAVVIAFIFFRLTQALNLYLLRQCFSWLPDWYIDTDLEAFKIYPKHILVVTFVIRLFLMVSFFQLLRSYIIEAICNLV